MKIKSSTLFGIVFWLGFAAVIAGFVLMTPSLLELIMAGNCSGLGMSADERFACREMTPLIDMVTIRRALPGAVVLLVGTVVAVVAMTRAQAAEAAEAAVNR